MKNNYKNMKTTLITFTSNGTNKKRGFTLLFASLVISLLLAIGLAIANISLQQFLLSSSGKESQTAFYNADTGIECGLFFDHGKVDGFVGFPTNTAEQNIATKPPYQIITCAGINSTNPPKAVVTSGSTTTTSYYINPANACNSANPSFEIEVTKVPLLSQAETFYTIIRSRGYNTCDNKNPRRVERGLEVKY